MLFLIVSTPHPSKPEDVKSDRLEFWSWIEGLASKKTIVCCYPRVGRGVVAIVDVPSNDELHKHLTHWTNIVPVSFEVYPLATPTEAEKHLK